MAAPLVIFSDVHLGPATTATTAAFLDFLGRMRRSGVRRLVCLGDLFGFWIGPGQERLPELAEVRGALLALCAAGVRLELVHGNRDFLLGPGEAAALGLVLLPGRAVVSAGGVQLALEHGDLLCARDTRYLSMRRVIRSRAVRLAVRALPLGLRLRLGRSMRRMSAREVAHKSTRTLALSPRAVRALAARHLGRGVATGVVGHVHHAALLRLEVGGRPFQLVTLGAWEQGSASWLEVDGDELRLRDGIGGARLLSAPLRPG